MKENSVCWLHGTLLEWERKRGVTILLILLTRTERPLKEVLEISSVGV